MTSPAMIDFLLGNVNILHHDVPTIVVIIVALNIVHWLTMENLFRPQSAKEAGTKSTKVGDEKEYVGKSGSGTSTTSIIVGSFLFMYFGCGVLRHLKVQIIPIESFHGRGRSDSTLDVALCVGVIAQSVFAMWLRSHAMSHLGAFFSRRLALQGETHRIVSTGPYGLVRHPGYTANVLLFPCFSFVVSGDAVLGLLMVLPYIIALTAVRIPSEEAMFLECRDGLLRKEYEQYRRKVTCKLIPFIY